jgi:hypothetical protein
VGSASIKISGPTSPIHAVFKKCRASYNVVMPLEGDRQPAKKLPNPETCRAIRAHGPGLVYCLVLNPGDCKHVRFLDEAAYCLNPDREDIIARTKSAI